MAISGVVGAIYRTSGTSTDFTSQTMTHETGSGNTRYFITDRTKAYWDDSASLTVEKSTNGGSSWAAVTTGFTIEYVGGYLSFAADQTSGATFRVTGKNFDAPAAVGSGFNWSVSIEVDTMEATTFGAGGWKEYLPAQRGWSGTFEKYFDVDETFISEVESGTKFVLVLYTDVGVAKTRFEGYATVTSNNVETPADDLITESCDFSGTGQLYYRAG